MELHARRWSGQHTSTIFSSCPAARAFYAEAVMRLAERGWAELATLELDGRLLAFSLCFLHDRTLYYYLPAFDPEYARYGPSTALLTYLIEAAFERGLRELDFMLGEEPYKKQWASGARGTSRLLIAAPGPTGLAALSAMYVYLAARERARGSALLRRVRRHGLTRLLARGPTA